MAVIDVKGAKRYGVKGSGIALFPCVCCLGDGAGGNHVQKIFSLTLN